MIERSLKARIEKDLDFGKILIIYGARQVGKTTLLKQITDNINQKTIWLNGDEPDVREMLTNANSSKLKRIVGNNKIVIIDEAQRIKDIGIVLKLLYDNINGIQIIATGSSSFELANEINEPLTGRKFEYLLFPLSFNELSNHFGLLEEKRALEHRLIYGSYPEIVVKQGYEKRLLINLTNSYLYQDILTFDRIKKPSLLEKLLKALALQIGSEIRYNELSNLLGCDKETIERYIDLLEKVYVIFRLFTFSRNARNEIKKSKKVYFYDNGIRNAVIGNFNPIEKRTDIGKLWENYLVSQRIILNNYNNRSALAKFWRTKSKQEIDYLEIENDMVSAFEFKWNPKANYKFPKTFTNNYKVNIQKTINRDNYIDFLSGRNF